ncbi:MAG: glycosyltransferase [Nanoarchaeota archaeon]|nr:glycosyltransferase [Nanoarchaeota archaeon]MBU4124448.1 glycosyltransferase [Nanoarchaeota archaeon]
MIGLLAQYNGILLVITSFALIVSSFWLFVYAFKGKEIRKGYSNTKFFPKLSIIIPAHNEAGSIGRTLKSVFGSNYPKNKIEVIVVDDGSTDNTLSIVKGFPVKIIRNIKKLGKVGSLNKAIKKAVGEIVITMDADTALESNSLALLIRQFEDPRVGAVSGVYKARNTKKMIEKVQALEYLWFGFTRKLQETLNCVLVIPGALGAFRRDVLIKVKGFDSDTMIEDYDMTIKVHKAGYKIKCEKDAIGWIDAPSSLLALMRQRIRWFRGGLQVYAKHSDIFKGKIGMITVLWTTELVGIVMQLLIFGLFGFEIIKHLFNYSLLEIFAILKLWLVDMLLLRITLVDSILFVSVILFIVGVINAALSVKIMKEPMRKMLLYPAMIFYSGILSFVFIKALFDEMVGTKRIWSLEHGKC